MVKGMKLSAELRERALRMVQEGRHRTAAGGHGSRAIIAMAWPPKQPAVAVTIYITETMASMSTRDEAIPRIGTALAKAL